MLLPSVSYRCRQCATVWPGCLPMAFRSSCHTGNLSTPFKAICSMQLFFQTTSCESTWHSAKNPMLSLLSVFLGTESQVWISATTFTEWKGCSFKGNWPLIACAKWYFLCVSPFNYKKIRKKSAWVSLEKEKLGRVLMLIIHNSFFCVLLKERWKSQNHRPVTLRDETCSDSRRRSQSFMSNDNCNHNCGENWNKDWNMKGIG